MLPVGSRNVTQASTPRAVTDSITAQTTGTLPRHSCLVFACPQTTTAHNVFVLTTECWGLSRSTVRVLNWWWGGEFAPVCRGNFILARNSKTEKGETGLLKLGRKSHRIKQLRCCANMSWKTISAVWFVFYLFIFTDIKVLCYCMSVFATNRNMFVFFTAWKDVDILYLQWRQRNCEFT